MSNVGQFATQSITTSFFEPANIIAGQVYAFEAQVTAGSAGNMFGFGIQGAQFINAKSKCAVRLIIKEVQVVQQNPAGAANIDNPPFQIATVDPVNFGANSPVANMNRDIPEIPFGINITAGGNLNLAGINPQFFQKGNGANEIDATFILAPTQGLVVNMTGNNVNTVTTYSVMFYICADAA